MERFSQDRKINNYGHRLIELCRSFDIHICNGRVGKDAYIGKKTSKDASVVDYYMDASPAAFDKKKV